MEALDQLSKGDSTVQVARLLLFLLFLVIELLPVTVKLMQPAGNYERIVRRMSTREMSQAEWDLRGGPGGAGSLHDDDLLRPTTADGDFGRGRGWGRRTRDPLDEDLTRLFEQRTRVESTPGRASSAQANEHATPRDDATGPHPFSDRIRGMTDTRAQSGPDGRPGGNERRYGDYRDDDF